jgi:SAM-dependent methyltransferase
MPQLDAQRTQAFAARMAQIYSSGVLMFLTDIGYRTGLFEAAATGPATSQALAGRAGLHERYVREWLAAMTTGGIFTYDPPSRTYTLPAEHAQFLAGHTSRNLAPQAGFIAQLGRHVPEVARCFREGGGVPYSAYRPEFTDGMDDTWRRIFDEQLISGFLPVAPGLVERLEAGIRVADIGCGTGHAVNVMARAYPASTFVGYDIAEDAIAAARSEAAAMGLANARFEVLDVTQLPAEPAFGLITAFDAIHDQVDPDAVLRRAWQALTPDGTFLMVDFKGSSSLERNLDYPFATLYYGVSLLHCMTVSLAGGGAGLGTMWGTELARQMLAAAGFTRVEVFDSPRPQNCIYVCRRD